MVPILFKTSSWSKIARNSKKQLFGRSHVDIEDLASMFTSKVVKEAFGILCVLSTAPRTAQFEAQPFLFFTQPNKSPPRVIFAIKGKVSIPDLNGHCLDSLPPPPIWVVLFSTLKMALERIIQNWVVPIKIKINFSYFGRPQWRETPCWTSLSSSPSVSRGSMARSVKSEAKPSPGGFAGSRRLSCLANLGKNIANAFQRPTIFWPREALVGKSFLSATCCP